MTPGAGRRAAGRAGDRGAGLVLAIGFVVMIGGIGAGLAALVSSSLNNRTALEQIRDRQYAADGAIEIAIAQQAERAAAACASEPGSTSVTLNSVAVRVEWRNACAVTRGGDGLLYVERNLLFVACRDTGTACGDDGIIRALVNFEQDAAGNVTRTSIRSWSVQQ